MMINILMLSDVIIFNHLICKLKLKQSKVIPYYFSHYYSDVII